MKKEKECLSVEEILDILLNDNDEFAGRLNESVNCNDKYLKIKNYLLHSMKDSRSKQLKKGKNCLDENLIAGYYDNILPVKLARKVEKHLSVCDYCLHQFLELHYIRKKIKSVKEKHISSKLKDMFKLEVKNKFFIKIKNELKGFIIDDTNLPNLKLSPEPIFVRSGIGTGIIKKAIAILPLLEDNIKIILNKYFKIGGKEEIEFKIEFPKKVKKNKSITVKIFQNKKLLKEDKINPNKNIFTHIFSKSSKYNIIIQKEKAEYSIKLHLK